MATRIRIASTGIARKPPPTRRCCSRMEAPLCSRGASARAAWTRSRASLPAHPGYMHTHALQMHMHVHMHMHCRCTCTATSTPNPEPPTLTPNLLNLSSVYLSSPALRPSLSHLTLTLPPPSPKARFEATADGLEEHVHQLIADACLSPLPPAAPPSPPSPPDTGSNGDPHLHLAHQGKAEEHVKGVRPPCMAAQLATAASP